MKKRIRHYLYVRKALQQRVQRLSKLTGIPAVELVEAGLNYWAGIFYPQYWYAEEESGQDSAAEDEEELVDGEDETEEVSDDGE